MEISERGLMTSHCHYVLCGHFISIEVGVVGRCGGEKEMGKLRSCQQCAEGSERNRLTMVRHEFDMMAHHYHDV